MYCSISSTVISATPSLMAYDSIAFLALPLTNIGALSSRCFASSVHISDGKDSFLSSHPDAFRYAWNFVMIPSFLIVRSPRNDLI